jgi:flagellum-specific peptidoglycan hydrolase FlgJ
MTIQQDEAAAAAAAKACQAKTALPASLTMAQWALESGWGAHMPGCNCFGIKSYPGCLAVQSLVTTEYVDGKPEEIAQKFAVFETLEACFEKHAELLKTGARYAPAWAAFEKSRDPETLARSIALHYATDPLYGAKLVALMRSARIQQALG